jgi:YHS domain-containing protein
MRQSVRYFAIPLGAISMIAIIAGCTQQSEPTLSPASSQAQTASKPGDEHAHKKSKRGGLIFSVGQDSYHVEAVFEKSGRFALYTLGPDESKLQELEAKPLNGQIKLVGADEDPIPIVLEAAPLDGDRPGMTSRFVGQLPKPALGKNIEIVVPAMRFGSERFRTAFRNYSDEHHEEPMPAETADAEERAIFLTPGGIYTEADIKANGNVTASQKFKGLRSEHNNAPEPGDRICPISKSKADAKFSWIVGGKTYQFCCPPCVREFVEKAKKSPGDIKPPEEYQKR